jgi:RNA polymerase sigma factor (sigma-70 family)
MEKLMTTAVDTNLGRAILTRERVGAALSQLTQEEQAVLALRFGEELSAREVSEIMGEPTSVVHRLQRQGLAALRLILAGMEKT